MSEPPLQSTAGEQSAPASSPRRAALGLPDGSVRALLALMITGGIWGWLMLRPEQAVPPYLRDLMFIIMGHYFAARSRPAVPGAPPPLYLPRGSVRLLLIGGFVGVATFLYRRQHLTAAGHLNQASVTLILVAGFLAGVLMTHILPHRLPRVVEDVKAFVSLAAGTLLLLLVFGVMALPGGGLEDFLLRHSIEEVLAALVGFYFGSRS